MSCLLAKILLFVALWSWSMAAGVLSGCFQYCKLFLFEVILDALFSLSLFLDLLADIAFPLGLILVRQVPIMVESKPVKRRDKDSLSNCT